MVDRASLNESERKVLRYLAQGHTVKSIAQSTGRTSGAINEKLREARRKTGVGSSRKLARLLAAQENRDTKIGMGAAPDAAAVPLPPGGRTGRFPRGGKIVNRS